MHWRRFYRTLTGIRKNERSIINTGIGVLISSLSEGNQSYEALHASIGKEIKSIDFNEENIILGFVDNTGLRLWDNGQSCCENRYMTTDDDLQYFVGAILQGADVKDGPTIDSEYGEEHETAFLVITTSKGEFTIETHNEHNGYYGGFAVVCRIV